MWRRAIWQKIPHYFESYEKDSADGMTAICGWYHKASDLVPDNGINQACGSCKRYMKKKGIPTS